MSALPRGIRQRGSAFVCDVTYRGQRRTGTAGTVEGAVLRRAELKAELTGQSVVTSKRPGGLTSEYAPRPVKAWTLKRALDAATQSCWRNTDWGLTAEHNASRFAAFVGADRPLASVSTETLETFARALEDEGKSAGTVNRYLAAVSKLLSVAVDWGGLDHKPKVPRRREPQGRIRYLSADEEARMVRLLRQWGKDDCAGAVVVLLDTGVRVGELFRIEWRDVNLKGGVVTVWETKNGHPRSVPMTSRVRAVLAELNDLRGDMSENSLVFSWSRWTLQHAWEKVRVQMGLADDAQFVPHALRHTCASRMVQRGVALAVIQKWLGHKSIQVTMRYAHLSPTSLAEAAAALEDWSD